MNGEGAARRRLEELKAAGGCLHPIRLAGRGLDVTTGEVRTAVVGVACKDRRRAICPLCAARYQDDAWHLVAAGLRGGKGVPKEVVTHPVVFATLTAPSFGAVHRVSEDRPCRPRRADARCAHGVATGCMVRHHDGDAVVGVPLCARCFDYTGAVLWNAHLGVLWTRTVETLTYELGPVSGQPVRALRGMLRWSHVKVAEFQRRGLVHLHVLVRADGPGGPATAPPPWLEADVAAAALSRAARRARVQRLGGGPPVTWGRELDVTALSLGDTAGGEPALVARYLAKYAVKGSEESGLLARRVGSFAEIQSAGLNPHALALVGEAWRLGGDESLAPLRLREHAHTFGYRGHFATKSRAYSTTFAALRAARAEFRGGAETGEWTWRYTGRGYATPSTDALAHVVADAMRSGRAGFPGTSPLGSRQFPRSPYQGGQA